MTSWTEVVKVPRYYLMEIARSHFARGRKQGDVEGESRGLLIGHVCGIIWGLMIMWWIK